MKLHHPEYSIQADDEFESLSQASKASLPEEIILRKNQCQQMYLSADLKSSVFYRAMLFFLAVVPVNTGQQSFEVGRIKEIVENHVYELEHIKKHCPDEWKPHADEAYNYAWGAFEQLMRYQFY
jgi:hypothetical protein